MSSVILSIIIIIVAGVASEDTPEQEAAGETEVAKLRQENRRLREKVARLEDTIQELRNEVAALKEGEAISKKAKAEKAKQGRKEQALDAFVAEFREEHKAEMRRLDTIRENLTRRLRSGALTDERRADIEDRLQRTEHEAEGLVEEIRGLEIGKIGRFPDNGGPAKRAHGMWVRLREVVQVIDKKQALVDNGNGMLWLKGIDTTNWADGRTVSFPGVFWVSGTRQYPTASGGTNTVFVLEPIDFLGDLWPTPAPDDAGDN